MAVLGAHVIALDVSPAQPALGRRLADPAEVRAEWHDSDAADLAFLTTPTRSISRSPWASCTRAKTLDRPVPPSAAVLAPGGAPFVISHEHPIAGPGRPRRHRARVSAREAPAQLASIRCDRPRAATRSRTISLSSQSTASRCSPRVPAPVTAATAARAQPMRSSDGSVYPGAVILVMPAGKKAPDPKRHGRSAHHSRQAAVAASSPAAPSSRRSSMRKASASPTDRPGRDAQERHDLRRRRGRGAARRAPPARAARRCGASSSSMRRARAAGLVRVARRAVAAGQLVETVEVRAGVAHVAAHRAVGPAHPVGVEAQVQLDEARHGRRRRRSGSAAPPCASGSCARPTTSWWWKLTPRGPKARVLGLPTSWNSAARRSRRSGEVLSTTAIVCASTSLCRWIGSCSSSRPGSSGRKSSARPVRTTNHRPADGSSTMTSLSSSSRIRSARDDGEPPVHAARSRPPGRHRARGRSAATKRAARSIRSGSSPKETSGSSGVRNRPAAGRPPVEGVDQLQVGQRERHGVDREVAARQVDVDVVAEGDLGLADSGTVDLGPVGRDLEELHRPCGRRWCRTRFPCVQTASAQPAQQPLDLIGPGVGGQVDVGRRPRRRREQRVTHRAAHQVERLPGGREAARQLLGGTDKWAEALGHRGGLHPPTVVRPLASSLCRRAGPGPPSARSRWPPQPS